MFVFKTYIYLFIGAAEKLSPDTSEVMLVKVIFTNGVRTCGNCPHSSKSDNAGTIA
jgi:hypothetical protein